MQGVETNVTVRAVISGFFFIFLLYLTYSQTLATKRHIFTSSFLVSNFLQAPATRSPQ